jgi:hypothetical protein
MLGWLGVVTALWLVRLAHYLRFRRQRSTEDHALRLAAQLGGAGAVPGRHVGLAVWLFWGWARPTTGSALMMIVFTYCLASVQLLASQSRVFLAFLCLVLTPTIVRVASDTSQAAGTCRWRSS